MYRSNGKNAMKEYPTPQTINQVFNQTLNRSSFVPCRQGECIDGWIPVPHAEGSYPAIGRVHRCSCFKKWAQSQST